MIARIGILCQMRLMAGVAALALATSAGCFSERYIPMERGDLIELASEVTALPPPANDTRTWVERVHPTLAELIPDRRDTIALTDDLLDDRGQPIDVYRRFDLNPRTLHQVFSNFAGLLFSAQASRAKAAIDFIVPPWPGFQDVWAPIDENLSYSGRLGFATRNGERTRADCIIILSGILGDLNVARTKALAQALRDNGFHVLALEPRGYGQTERRYPNAYCGYGVLEASELLVIERWLRTMPEVRRVGLIGFCWGGNLALLTAWEDGRGPDDPAVGPKIAPLLRKHDGRRHFEAGILAFSPFLDFEPILDTLARPWPTLENPVLAAIQEGINDRAARKRYPALYGNLRELVRHDFGNLGGGNDEATIEQGLAYLRLMPLPEDNTTKLDRVRVPVLMVHSANDPLVPAQDVAVMMARTRNPLVAAVVLPNGGHVGFAAYARAYTYSLIMHFFDPKHGAAALR